MKRTLTLVSFLFTLFVTMGHAQPSPIKCKSKDSKNTVLKTGTVQSKFNTANESQERTAPKTSTNEIFEIPFYDNFSDGQKTNENYTFLDANGDGHENINKWFWKEDEKLIQYNSDNGVTGDDWLITPGIHFKGGCKYQLKFNINMGSQSNLKVTFGDSTDPTNHTEILDLKGIIEFGKTCHEVIFEVPSEGTYYIGFQNYSTDCFYFNLFDINIVSKEEYVPGTIFEVPYADDFEDGDRTNAAYTFVDVDNDGHDNQSEWFWKADEKLVQYCSDKEHAGNDWFITPPIHFDGKNLYDLAFTINMGMPSNLKVLLGTSTDPKDFTTEIIDLNQIHEANLTEHKASFKVPAEGTYYIGFYNYSDASSFYFNLFNIRISKGISATCPDKISNLEVIPGENGEVSATLKFNAPETTIGGEKLEGTFSIEIYRNEELIKTLDATAGEFITYEDHEVQAGLNNYKIIVKAGDLESAATEMSKWIGPDISEPVKELNAVTTEDNMHVILNWQAPQKGLNEGYFDINLVTYNVYRGEDRNNFIKIATVTDLTYTDTEIEEILAGSQDSYFYAVTAVTPSGESDPAIELISVGTPYHINNYESFENGKFNINPWTTESIEGSFGWTCIRRDKSGGGYAQDHDKGLIRFRNDWSAKADSRLKTPVFDLTGSKNPTFSFYMFHWEASSIEADNKQTKCTIEVSVDGGEFEAIAEPFTAAYPEYGWHEHRISLEKYKDAKKVQFALRGFTDNTWMYYYVDNIRIDEQYANDLSISEFFATDAANVNEIAQYDVKYSNRGTEVVSDYTIDLYQDYELVESVKGEPINPGEQKNISISHILNASKADTESVFYAVINFKADEEPENNTSWELYTKVKGTWYPGVENLKGEIDNQNNVDINWSAPAIPNEPQIVTDGFETYLPFIIEDIGNWITVDNDGRGSGCVPESLDFAHKGKNMAFIVWCPSQIEGFSSEKYPNLTPRTGEKCLLAWYANTNIDGNGAFNDDYLISPEVLGGSTLKFYTKRAGNDVEENYEIMYSSTSNNIESFSVLENKVAGEDWELIEITLPEDARYFAIHYTGVFQTGILIDDMEYTSAISDLKLQGYNIFRNGAKINDELVNVTEYHDTNVDNSVTYSYQVSAVYDRGESNACDPIYITIPTGIDNVETNMVVYPVENGIVIESNAAQNVAIYTTDGRTILSKVINGRTFIPTANGLYIVNVNGKGYKIMVK